MGRHPHRSTGSAWDGTSQRGGRPQVAWPPEPPPRVGPTRRLQRPHRAAPTGGTPRRALAVTKKKRTRPQSGCGPTGHEKIIMHTASARAMCIVIASKHNTLSGVCARRSGRAGERVRIHVRVLAHTAAQHRGARFASAQQRLANAHRPELHSSPSQRAHRSRSRSADVSSAQSKHRAQNASSKDASPATCTMKITCAARFDGPRQRRSRHG